MTSLVVTSCINFVRFYMQSLFVSAQSATMPTRALGICLLMVLQQQRQGGPRLPPELFELLYHAFVDPVNSLRLFCARGRLKALRHWHATFGICVPAHDRYVAFCDACACGQLEVAQWLHANMLTSDVGIAHDTDLSAMFATTPDIHGPGMRTMLAKYNMLPNEAIGVNELNAHMARCLKLIRRRASADLTEKNIGRYLALVMACRGGHLATAQWVYSLVDASLFAAIGPTVFRDKGARAEVLTAFFSACEYGHAHVVQWLHDMIQVTDDDMRWFQDVFVGIACANAHVDVVRWFRHTLHVPEANIPRCYINFFRECK